MTAPLTLDVSPGLPDNHDKRTFLGFDEAWTPYLLMWFQAYAKSDPCWYALGYTKLGHPEVRSVDRENSFITYHAPLPDVTPGR